MDDMLTYCGGPARSCIISCGVEKFSMLFNDSFCCLNVLFVNAFTILILHVALALLIINWVNVRRVE